MESIQTMKRTRRILVTRPGSRVDAYVTECVREMMGVKRRKMNGEVNKIGRRVRDVIANGDVLDRGLGLWNVPSLLILGLSTPLALEQRATGRSGRPFLIGVHALPGAE
jgi:hypothetical protein